MDVFARNGIEFSPSAMGGVAPVLFREEAVYRREVNLGDIIEVHTQVTKLSEDAGRWSMTHEILRPDGTLAATIEADGAWIDMTTRKLALPTPPVAQRFQELFAQAQREQAVATAGSDDRLGRQTVNPADSCLRGVSLTRKPGDRFDVLRHGEQIEGTQPNQLVAECRQIFRIPRERHWITCHVNDRARLAAGRGSHHGATGAGPWRVKDNDVGM